MPSSWRCSSSQDCCVALRPHPLVCVAVVLHSRMARASCARGWGVGVRAWGARHFARRGFGVKNKKESDVRRRRNCTDCSRNSAFQTEMDAILPRGSTINLFLKKTQVKNYYAARVAIRTQFHSLYIAPVELVPSPLVAEPEFGQHLIHAKSRG